MTNWINIIAIIFGGVLALYGTIIGVLFALSKPGKKIPIGIKGVQRVYWLLAVLSCVFLVFAAVLYLTGATKETWFWVFLPGAVGAVTLACIYYVVFCVPKQMDGAAKK